MVKGCMKIMNTFRLMMVSLLVVSVQPVIFFAHDSVETSVVAIERTVAQAIHIMNEARGHLFDKNRTKKDDKKNVEIVIAQNSIIVQAKQQLKKEENAVEIIKGLLEQQKIITYDYDRAWKAALSDSEQAHLKNRYEAVIAQFHDAIYVQQLITGDVMSTQKKLLWAVAAVGTAAALVVAKHYFNEVFTDGTIQKETLVTPSVIDQVTDNSTEAGDLIHQLTLASNVTGNSTETKEIDDSIDQQIPMDQQTTQLIDQSMPTDSSVVQSPLINDVIKTGNQIDQLTEIQADSAKKPTAQTTGIGMPAEIVLVTEGLTGGFKAATEKGKTWMAGVKGKVEEYFMVKNESGEQADGTLNNNSENDKQRRFNELPWS